MASAGAALIAPAARAQEVPTPNPTETPAPPPPKITLPAVAPPPPPEDDLPIPTLTIERIPPSTSFEFAVQVSYGEVAYFKSEVGPWVGFGFRGGWGKNFGVHRLGVAALATAEGDLGIHTQLGLEPSANWDFVSAKGVLLGAGVGPAIIFTSENDTVQAERGLEVAPVASARIGWSQTWSRVGRRLFVYLEPKARVVNGSVSPVVALAVGSGAGR